MVDYLLREGDLVGEGRSEARGLDGQDHGGCYGVRGREELKVEDAGGVPGGESEVELEVYAVVSGHHADVVARLGVLFADKLKKGISVDRDGRVGW